MVDNFLGTDMTRDEFMERLKKDQNLMWATDAHLAEKDQQVEQLERTVAYLKDILAGARKDHRELLSFSTALVQAICDHFGIREKYGLQDRALGSEDFEPVLQMAWGVAELLDWRECPR